MKGNIMRKLHRIFPLLAIWFLSSGTAFGAGFVTLPNTAGASVNCVPPGSPAGTNNCQVTVLVQPGYTQVMEEIFPVNDYDILTGAITGPSLGTITKRLWRQGTTFNFIFGVRITTNTNIYNGTGKSLELNSIRWVPLLPGANNAFAFFKTGAGDENIFSVSRTYYQSDYIDPPGVFPIHVPVTELATTNSLNFKTDVNANDPDGTSRSSPWILIKCVGDSQTISGARYLNGSSAQLGQEAQTPDRFNFSSFACN
jgi:hypothetical protein